jgi:two-component system, response regulator PdtaR
LPRAVRRSRLRALSGDKVLIHPTMRTAYPHSPSFGIGRAAAFVTQASASRQKESDDVKSILIVEDDFLAASEMEAALLEAGFAVAGIANRAEEAVRLAKSQKPALAIMDIRLIGRPDGIDTAIQIFRETGIRSIFATAHNDARRRARALPASPLGWLPKPFAPHALVAMVRRALTEL